MNANTNRTSTNSKKSIPAVKHFYDADAARKTKALAKKVANSNLVKKAKAAAGMKSGSKTKRGKKTAIEAALAAPVAVQIGTFAVLAAGGFALWKNRDKIRDLISGIGSGEEAPTSDMGA